MARRWAVLCAAAALLATVLVARWKLSTPAVGWLDDVRPATWILYPSPSDTATRKIVPLESSFRKSFRLEALPASARLRYRAFREGSVRINGALASERTRTDWKSEQTVDATGLLRRGDNVIEAYVSNASGPPALWLALELPGTTIASDTSWTASWAGAAPLAAVSAREPRPGHAFDPDRRVMSAGNALRSEWRLIALFLGSCLVAFGVLVVARRRHPTWHVWSSASAWPVRLALVLIAALWTIMLLNNSRWLPLSVGFDSADHLEYARFVLEQRSLPFASDGWQMFQPPLYYMLLAGLFAASGISPSALDAAWVVRGLGLAIGLAHLALIAASLRMIFPGHARRQVAGLVVGAFLPCMLYLHHYPSNEPLMAMLASACVLVALRLLRQDEPRFTGHVILGALLGLALLAKSSALLLLPPLLGAAIGHALCGEQRWRKRRLVAAATAALTTLATCGWYYASVWRRFGTPLVGGWDPRPGMAWWQDPGYRTTADFLRFGRSFLDPLFAGFGGFWDGLYSTLWGDGLLSGLTNVALVPPWWSPSLMPASLALSAGPAIAVVFGGFALLARWLRRPDATTGILVSLAFVVFVSILFMSVTVPTVSADKATYGLMAAVPLCAFAGYVFDLVSTRSRWSGPALAAGLGVWALTSFATYWISPWSSKSSLLEGMAAITQGDESAGIALLEEAHRRDPEDWSARIVLGGFLLRNGAPAPSVRRLLGEPHEGPDLAFRHVALSALALRLNDSGAAEQELRRALALDVDNADAHAQLAMLRRIAGDRAGATDEWRQVLRIDPQSQRAHRELERLYSELGDSRAAEAHGRYSALLGE